MTVDLVARFEQSLPIFLEENGFPIGTLLALHHDDTVTVARIATQQEEIFDTAMSKFMTDLTVKEIIFGIDCYTQPGQGTRYKDVLTVFWWQGERVNEHYGFMFGVINYRPPPRARIDPIDWDNTFWNAKMAEIVASEHARMMTRIKAARKKLGDARVDEMYRKIADVRTDIIDGKK